MNEATIHDALDEAHSNVVEVPLNLSTRPGSSSFNLLLAGQPVGVFSGPEADRYGVFGEAIRGGVMPVVMGRAERSGDGDVTLELILPEPDVCLPQNLPPYGKWVLLPNGPSRPVYRVSGEQVAELRDVTHLLVSLRFDNAGEVAVRAFYTQIGWLSGEDAARITPLLRRLENMGYTPAARAYLDPETRELTVQVGLDDPEAILAALATEPQIRAKSSPVYSTDTAAAEFAMQAEAAADDTPAPFVPCKKCHKKLARISSIITALLIASVGGFALLGQVTGNDTYETDLRVPSSAGQSFNGVD